MLGPGAATVASSGAAPSEFAEDADVRRTLRYDGAATTAATSSPERRMAMAIPLGDDWMQTLDRATGRCARVSLRRRPRSPFSDFPNNGARRIVPEPPPPIPSAHLFPRSPPLTSSPSPSHQTVLLQHEDPRGIVGPSRVRGPRDSPGDLPPLRRPAEHPRDGAPPARRVEKGTPPAPRVRDATHQNRPTATPPAGRPPSLRVPATLPRRRGPAVGFVPLVPRPAPVRHQTVVGVRERRARRLDARRNPRRSRRRVRTSTRTWTRTTRT